MNIEKQSLPAATYAGKTAKIKISELQNNPIFMEVYGAMGTYAGESGQTDKLGSAAAIYKSWDPKNDETELMPAFAVREGFDFGDFEKFDVSAGEALVGTHKGSYSGLKSAHEAVMKAVEEGGYTAKLTIEEYVNDPSKVSEEELETRIVYYI